MLLYIFKRDYILALSESFDRDAFLRELDEVDRMPREIPFMFERRGEQPYDLFGIGEDGGIATLVTKIRDSKGEFWTGNVGRGGCAVAGAGLCKMACQSPERDNEDKMCADQNLREALEAANTDPQTVLMVGVTPDGDGVGFFDELELTEQNKNSVGIFEVKGYNAFAARAFEYNDAMQVRSLGSRLADCAHIGIKFRDDDSNTVIGFIHGTRNNLQGESARKYERDGKKVSFVEHALAEMLEHYNANPQNVSIRVSAAIAKENWPKRFADEAAMEKHLPGWFKEGWLTNPQNPDWKPGDPIDPEHVWEADYRGKVLHDLKEAMQNLGIDVEHQLETDDMLDPAAPESRHSSHTHDGAYRDLYLTGVDLD